MSGFDSIRSALAAMKAAGFVVHHIEIGALLWQQMHVQLSQCPSRDDVGYGTRPGGGRAPVIDGVVAVPSLFCCLDEWGLVFSAAGDTAADQALTPEHRAAYEKAMVDGILPDNRRGVR